MKPCFFSQACWSKRESQQVLCLGEGMPPVAAEGSNNTSFDPLCCEATNGNSSMPRVCLFLQSRGEQRLKKDHICIENYHCRETRRTSKGAIISSAQFEVGPWPSHRWENLENGKKKLISVISSARSPQLTQQRSCTIHTHTSSTIVKKPPRVVDAKCQTLIVCRIGGTLVHHYLSIGRA